MATEGKRVRVVLEIKPTDKPIRFVLDARSYARPGDDVTEAATYLYEEHTCPSNWFDEIVRIEVGDDKDPHGFVQLVECVEYPEPEYGPRWVCDACSGYQAAEPTRPQPERCQLCGELTTELICEQNPNDEKN